MYLTYWHHISDFIFQKIFCFDQGFHYLDLKFWNLAYLNLSSYTVWQNKFSQNTISRERRFDNFSHFIWETEIFQDVDQNGNPGL